jgi:hypothetical protein
MPIYTFQGISYNYSTSAPTYVSSGANASGNVTILSSFNVGGITYNVTSIGESAFFSKSNITSVSIPSGIETIVADVFNGCTNLTSVSLPNTLVEIGPFSFYGCTSLTNISFPSSLQVIGEYCFANCTSLTSISIPSTLQVLGDYAFDGCTGITSITDYNGNTGLYQFSNIYIGQEITLTVDHSQPLTWTIPEMSKLVFAPGSNVTIINGNAQFGIGTLKSLVIPNTVTTINGGTGGYSNLVFPPSITDLDLNPDNYTFTSSDLQHIYFSGTINAYFPSPFNIFYNKHPNNSFMGLEKYGYFVTGVDYTMLEGYFTYYIEMSQAEMNTVISHIQQSSRILPNIPTISSVTVTASGTTATINFTPGASNGSSPITGYRYAISTNGGNSFGPFKTSNWTSGTSFTVSGLNANSTYHFKIMAVTSIGSNSFSSTSSGVTLVSTSPPPTPTITSVTISQSTSTINFTAGAANGSSAVTSYKYAFSTTGASGTYGSFTTSNWTSGTSFTVSGLTSGSTYHFKIIAHNGLDSIESSASSAVTVENFAPNAPTILSASGSNTIARVIFIPGTSNGSFPVTNYAYSTDPIITQNSVFTLLPIKSDGTFQTTSPLTINGLSNGQAYSFTLKAFNGLYSSTSSTISNIFINTAQPPPTIQSISGRNGSASIRFTQQTNNSASITGYAYSTDAVITDNTVFTLLSVTTSPLIINGLTNNQEYFFTLKSFNGSYSRASATVPAMIYPPTPAPVISSVSGANGTALINFTQESSTPPINYYLYSTNLETFNHLPLRNGQPQRTSPLYIDNLNSLQTYVFSIKSFNGSESIPSNSFSAYINSSQPAPVITSVTSNGTGVARITITQALNNSPAVQNYFYNVGTGWRLFDPPQTSTTLVLRNLNMPSNYNFTLRSFNGYISEDSNTINNVLVNFPAPSAPVITSVLFVNNKIRVFFNSETTNPSIIKYVYSTNDIINSRSVFSDLDYTTGFYEFPYSGSSGDIVHITIRAFNGRFSMPSTTVVYTVVSNTVSSGFNNTVLVSIRENIFTILNGRRVRRDHICYSTNNGINWTSIEKWPFVIGNSSNDILTVRFTSDISLSLSNLPLFNQLDKMTNYFFPINTNTTSSFFVINGNKITIDGNYKDVLIDNNFSSFTPFHGFIQNGTATSNGYNDITVQNLNIRNYRSNSTLREGEGLLCKSYFGKSSINNLINNCNIYEYNISSDRGRITKNSGGISGQYTGINSTNFIISNCIVECDIATGINGENSGGIIGPNSGSLSNMVINNCVYTGDIAGKNSGGIIGAMSSNIKITNCATSGAIYSGGIAGTLTGVVTTLNNGLVEITDCNTSGDIISVDNNNNPGGIVSDYAGNVIVTRCYSKGQIGDAGKNSSGGIIGSFAGTNGSVIIDKCFSLGTISHNCGGIAAENFGVYSGRLHAIKLSYSVGDIGNNAGGIVGPNIGPNYTNSLNYNFQSDPNNPVFTGLGYGYGSSSGSSNRNAFINILGCCSYGSLANSYSGGIIARTTQTYPAFLTGNKFFLKMLTVHGCVSYGTPISTNTIQTSYQNFVNSSYENIYNNNSIIGGESTLPPVQGIFNETIREYNGSLLNDIDNIILDTSTNYLNNSDIKPRINTGLYIGLDKIPNSISLKKILLLAYPIPTIIINNFSTLYNILNTTNITPSLLNTPFGGGYTIRNLVNINTIFLNLFLTKFNITYTTLISQGIIPVEFYNANIYSISWFRDTLGYKVVDFLNNGFKLIDLFPTYTVNDVYDQGHTVNLFHFNNISARTLSRLPGTTMYDFQGGLYNAASTWQAYGMADNGWPLTGNIFYDRRDIFKKVMGHDWNKLGNMSNVSGGARISSISQLPPNFTSADLVGTNVSVRDLVSAGFSRGIIAGFRHFSVAQLKAEGFTTSDLKTSGYTNSQMLEGGFTNDQINGAEIQTRQPAPVITDIATYQGFIEVSFKQAYTNCSPEIITYYYSLDGVNFTLLKNPYQTKSPLIIPVSISSLGDTIVTNLFIGSYNGLPSAIPNTLVLRQSVPFEGRATVTQQITAAMNSKGSDLNPNCLPTAGRTVSPGIGNIGFVGNVALGPMGMGVLPGADENYGAEPTLEGSDEHIKRNVATQLVAFAISKAPVVGFYISVADVIIQYQNQSDKEKWDREGRHILVPTNLPINWINRTPNITSVTYSGTELKIYFTQGGNDDVDGYLYSISNSVQEGDWLFVPGVYVSTNLVGYKTSPLIIRNILLPSDSINNIKIRAYNQQPALYNGIYSVLANFPNNYGEYIWPVKRIAYSNPSNIFQYQVALPNIPPEVKMRVGYSNIPQISPSFTEPNAINVWFFQRSVNAGGHITKYACSINDGDNYIFGNDLVSPLISPYSSQNQHPYVFRGLTHGINRNIRFKSWNGQLSRDGSYTTSIVSVYGAPSVPQIFNPVFRYKGNDVTFTINFSQPKYSGNKITFYLYSTDAGVTWRELPGVTKTPLTITLLSENNNKITRGMTIRFRLKASNQLPINTLPPSVTTTNNVYNQQNIIYRNLGFRFGHTSADGPAWFFIV